MKALEFGPSSRLGSNMFHVWNPARPSGYTRISEFTATVLSMWIVYGALIFSGGLFPWNPSYSLSLLPSYLEFLIGSFISIGGVLALMGGTCKNRLASEHWSQEIFGLVLGGVGWLCLTISTAVLNPLAPLPYVVGLSMCIAAFWRARRVLEVSKYTREQAKGGV